MTASRRSGLRHEWAKRQAARAGIGYRELSNGFAACDDPAAVVRPGRPAGQVLPSDAFLFYAELVTVLQVAPWSGGAYDRQRPDANMRAHAFGEHGEGLVVYVA